MYHRSTLQEIKHYGDSAHRPPAITELVAGKLRCQYEGGNLRYVRVGDTEILRMIYSAVRDQNWDTIAPEISQEEIVMHPHSFIISYDCRYRQGEIDFLAHYRIRGEADGSIRFVMDGEVLNPFQRNRIGFCILHPASVAGANCQIDHADGSQSEGQFPTYISPHQPFKNIRQMQWSPSEETRASLEFLGDIFETEDQRNWTDDSFKTYCTPLDLPFPVSLQKGEKIHQEVKLRLEQAPENSMTEEKPLRIAVSEKGIPLPAIGIGHSTEVEKLTNQDISLLQAVNFTHYRVDIHLCEPSWQEKWQRAVTEASALKWPLEVALHVDNNTPEQITDFASVATSASVAIRSILLFDQLRKVTSPELLGEFLPKLRQHFPDTKIGSGTDHFFTELNRERLPPDHLDFVSYSINPQVHHFDNQSLIETLQAQSYTVASAKQFAKEASIKISPVTLKMRRNPNATGPASSPAADALPPSVDTRQLSLFGAGWTVGSLRNLIQSGVDSLTYFETVGRKGILAGGQPVSTPDLFPAKSGTVYPMYLVFRFLLEKKNCTALPTTVSEPWRVEGLAVHCGIETRAILANLQPEPVEVNLPKGLFAQMKLLDESRYELAIQQPNKFLSSDFGPCSGTITLPPYAIVFLTSLEKRPTV